MMELVLRRLARVKRGDTWRSFLRNLRSKRNRVATPHVRVGPLHRPHWALLLEDADMHALRQESIRTILNRLDKIPLLLDPIKDREPWRLRIQDQSKQSVIDLLKTLPRHWDRRYRGDELLLLPRFAIDSSRALDEPSLGVTIRFYEARNTSDGAPALEEGRDLLSKLAATPEPEWPIDLVYTWVDGDDPEWQRRRNHALDHAEKTDRTAPSQHPNATDLARYASVNELLYSLRSVYQFANWVRHIYVVTDGQRPGWMTTDHPKITVIDHKEILPDSSFNSHAIESALHRIPGLSEHYLYLNDDVFFGRMAFPSDYFTLEGRAKFFPSELEIPAGEATRYDKPIIAAAKNGREIMQRRFGHRVTQRISHSVHAQRRSVVERMERDLPDEFKELERSPFRSPTDISVASALHHWYAQALGKAVPSSTNYYYLNITQTGSTQGLEALRSLRRHDVFCLNQEETTAESDKARKVLRSFLKAYFPLSAPWERQGFSKRKPLT